MVRRLLLSLALLALPLGAARAETQVINGVRYECADGLCRRVDDDGAADAAPAEPGEAPRIAQGYMDADEFLAFLKGETPRESPLPKSALWLVLALLAAGLALNLTPCVLPMIPVNLIVIGQSFRRGLLYGLGLAAAYGALGVGAAFGGLAFGAIQASPLFNGLVALVFLALAVALLRGGFSLDVAGGKTPALVAALRRLGVMFPFFMGATSALLAGACVAPILVSTLVLTADLAAQGHRLAWMLPFVLGLGMALPWPFLGAGLRVLPRPGAWMRGVNRAFAALLVVFAAWYGWLAVGAPMTSRPADAGRGGRPWPPARSLAITSGERDENGVVELSLASPLSLSSLASLLSSSSKPVLVDCWAPWCKNCAAMERGTLRDPRVVAALDGFVVVRLRADDVGALRRLPGFAEVRGLPTFAVFAK